jgi:hypothetical protein
MQFDPSSIFDMTHAATFLGGTFVGAAGKYVADRFTDQRHRKEARATESKRLAQLKKIMPKLLAEMRADLIKNRARHVREFVVLSNPGVTFNHAQSRFEYFETVHQNVRNYVSTLLAEKYIEVVKDGQCPIYRFTEAFVSQLENDT